MAENKIEMDRDAIAHMERFAEFMARMIEKYGRDILKEIENESKTES